MKVPLGGQKCLCVCGFSPVGMCESLLFLKTQLKWHLFQEAFCSTLAKSIPPLLLSECLCLDKTIYATCDDAGLHLPLSLQALCSFLIRYDSAQMV